MGPDQMMDMTAAMLVRVGAKGFRYLAHNRSNMPRFQAASDRVGIQVRSTHYYEPTYRSDDLPGEFGAERDLPGIDFAPERQLEFLGRCRFGAELSALPWEHRQGVEFGFNNGAFGPGDAEMLYNMIRVLRPRRILEIGSGRSTQIARLAVEANVRDEPDYRCEHACIEPYEQPWLEQLGVTVLRERVEKVGLAPFLALESGDILFIDSSHIIRPCGDVLFELHEIIPRVSAGVHIHVHDIFTPRDYPEKWVRHDRRLWNEQYLLESFLAFNDKFEIVSMLNWLHHNHRAALAATCPVLGAHPEEEPGSFWFRRKA